MADYISRYTGEEVDERLALAETALQEQAQADWEQTDTSAPDYIKNKPDLDTKQDVLVSGENIKTVNGESILGEGNIVAGDPNAVKYVQQELNDAQKAQARTNIGAGTYSKPDGGIPAADLASDVIPTVPVQDVTVGGTSVVSSGTAVIPAIPSAPGTLNTNNTSAQTAKSSEALSGTIKLHKVSKTGNYNDLLDKPTIPAAQIQSDWDQSDNTALDYIKNKPTIPDTSNFVQKSQTAGLLKNDGTVDTTVYGTYSKPSGGIPETDLASAVQTSLGLARSAVQSLSDYYTKAQVDDIAAAIAASVDSTSGVVVTTLPTAAADTLGKIYYVGPDASGFYDRYVTSYDGSSYSWLALGNTEVDMTQYATVEQLDELISPELTTANRRITSSGVAAPSTTNQNLIVTMFPVIGGKTYYVSGRNYGDDTYLCGFLDSSKTFIANSALYPVASYNNAQENLEVIAPASAAYIVVAGDLRAANGNTPAVSGVGTLNDVLESMVGQMEVLRGWVTGRCMKTNQGVGNVCPKTTEAYASHRYAVITIEPGARYVINGTGTSTYHLWAFLDASNVIISTGGNAHATGNELVLTPPANATQLILNGLNADEGSFILRGDIYGFMKRSDLVNNLNGGENAPLAAEQGKVLSDRIAADEVKHNSEILSQIVSYTMNFVAGTNHSSASDQMKINIPAGTHFLARFTMGTAQFANTRSLYAFYADGTNESLGAMTRGNKYQKVAKKDIIAFGNYSAGADITASGTMGLEIWSNDGRDGVSIVAVNDIRRIEQGIIANHKAAGNGNGVSLLHFSDIHGQENDLSRIVRIKNMFANYIEDAICTGDMLYDKFSDSFAFWGNSGAQDILAVLGNHDAWTSSSGTASETAANCYNKFFGNIAEWGVTSPGTGLCYYYKDYANKVRLIVLDCMHMDSAQLTWITETLASAKAAGLTVVIASHYTPSTMANMTFNRNTTFTAYGVNYTHTTFDTVVPVELLVKDFIDGGGKFACWLCGHYHTDIFGFSEHGQPVICIDKACVTLANNYYSRVAGTRTQDLFNIISIDADAQVIRIFRIGCTLDYMMRPVETLAYNYGTQEAIYNC